jgi:predicted DNA-binding protein
MAAEETLQTAFRLPVSLLERLDAYADRLRAEQPGINITRADVVRLLLSRALSEVEAAAPRQSGLRRRR